MKNKQLENDISKNPLNLHLTILHYSQILEYISKNIKFAFGLPFPVQRILFKILYNHLSQYFPFYNDNNNNNTS